MATDALQSHNGDNSNNNSTPSSCSRFQQMVNDKLSDLCAKSDMTLRLDKGIIIIPDGDDDHDDSSEHQSPSRHAFLASPTYHFDFSTTPSQASSAKRCSRPPLLSTSPSPRINSFENGYVGPEKRASESSSGGSSDENEREDGEVSEPEPEPEPEPAAKRVKKSPALASGPSCTCAVSTSCARAAANCVRDCRLALISIPKKTKPVGNNAKQGLITTRYISKKKQMEIRRSNDEILDILSQFRRCRIASEKDLPRIFHLMRNRVHLLHLYEIPSSSITTIKSRFLDPLTGLPAIVQSDVIPWDIRLDAEMYLMRLKLDDIDPDIHRGLIVSRSIQQGITKSLSRSLDPNYRFKRSSFFIGEGHLRIGQWFPYRICAIRDGAHGELEGGISGRENLGAISVILSSSGTAAYPDIDQGDTILYCGTRGKNGKVSLSTSFMLESSAKKNDIRVLRSSKLPKLNPYRPAEGIRYDGLYRITEHELLDEDAVLYRFTLKRVEGQFPIRYRGPEARPTAREVKELRHLKEHVSLTKPTTSKRN